VLEMIDDLEVAQVCQGDGRVHFESPCTSVSLRSAAGYQPLSSLYFSPRWEKPGDEATVHDRLKDCARESYYTVSGRCLDIPEIPYLEPALCGRGCRRRCVSDRKHD
jgi:hypothetical protein